MFLGTTKLLKAEFYQWIQGGAARRDMEHTWRHLSVIHTVKGSWLNPHCVTEFHFCSTFFSQSYLTHWNRTIGNGGASRGHARISANGLSDWELSELCPGPFFCILDADLQLTISNNSSYISTTYLSLCGTNLYISFWIELNWMNPFILELTWSTSGDLEFVQHHANANKNNED